MVSIRLPLVVVEYSSSLGTTPLAAAFSAAAMAFGLSFSTSSLGLALTSRGLLPIPRTDPSGEKRLPGCGTPLNSQGVP